jgi:xanthine dehydrogenase YagS FAD-binding subunit
MIHDMMPSFELFQPARIEDALALLDRHDKSAWKLAGGNDSFDWFKDRIKRPRVVIDLTGIAELKGIRQTAQGIEIGAATTLAEIGRTPLIREKCGLLADAARKVASPQIRNSGTLGGNIGQDTRCWYYRDGFHCHRAGGNTCYASAPTSMNREHAIFGADRCMAVSVSDTAPALVALGATITIRSPKGEREVQATDFFIGPSVDITRMTVLTPKEIVTLIRIPATFAGARFYFEKVGDREGWDFALVNVASAMILKGDSIEQAGIACGGVECVPRRLSVVEEIVRGQRLNDDTAKLAGQAAVRGAAPLTYNGFKVALLENLVARAIRGV